MKKMKKLLSMLLAVVMVLAMAAPSFAADNGTITISKARSDQEYNIYQMFSYDKENKTYTVLDAWKGFITQNKYNEWFSIDATSGVLTENLATNDVDFDRATFAKEALKYAGEQGIEATKTVTAENNTAVFTECAAGFYLLDSSAGAICSLNTLENGSDGNVVIEEKNEKPTVGKEITKVNNAAGTTSSVSIGDVLEYTITLKAQQGAENYVVYDKMPAGLSFTGSVEVKDSNNNTVAIAPVDSTTVPGYAYYQSSVEADKSLMKDATNTFELHFNKAFCDSITAEKEYTIVYTVTVNDGAIERNADGSVKINPMTNKAGLKYGDPDKGVDETPSSDVTVEYYSFGLMKTNAKSQPLSDAEFELYNTAEDAEQNQNKIGVVKSDYGYRLADPVSDSSATTTIKAGNIVIAGLKEGTYYLKEIKAPSGYNKVEEARPVVISKSDYDAGKLSVMLDADENYKSGGIQVINNTGTLLPSTGGIGTTIFYAVGIILMAGAVFFVVRRKRA